MPVVANNNVYQRIYMATSGSMSALKLPERMVFQNAVECSALLKKAITEACQANRATGSKVAVIDASAVRSFDSAALAVLLQCRRDADALKCTIAIQNMPSQLRELTHLYGVAELLPDAA